MRMRLKGFRNGHITGVLLTAEAILDLKNFVESVSKIDVNAGKGAKTVVGLLEDAYNLTMDERPQ